MIKYFITRLFVLFIASISFQCTSNNSTAKESKAFLKLKEASRSDDFWVQVHALEFMQNLGYQSAVDSVLPALILKHKNIPQERIGVWRIGAQKNRLKRENDTYIAKIRTVYVDTTNTDRLHAAESLAKLGYSLGNVPEKLVEDDLRKGFPFLGYVLWGKSLPTEPDGKVRYHLMLDEIKNGKDEKNKEILAYALTKIHGPISKKDFNILESLSEDTDLNELTINRLKLALFLKSKVHYANSEKKQILKSRILEFLKSNNKSLRYSACEALAHMGSESDIEQLTKILQGENVLHSLDLSEMELSNANLDCQSAAAYALLSIKKKTHQKLSYVDWSVIIVFLLLMVLIGYFYSRNLKNKEDYLLGGRSMNPYMVGISLFATLLSTLSYLAYPGEMIKYGPMVFFGILAFPVAYYIVGNYLIPQFMELKVTSAYEILEVKLGSETRDLATIFFLMLRFFWMSTIVYATVNTALIHIMGFHPVYVPLVCLVLALVTILYTVMGGIKAVVLTDAIQSGILFAGAILSIVLISIDFDNSTDWFPTSWLKHWEPMNWSIDFNQRMTVGNIFIMTLVWQVCTAGSDQMAIQRYLSTSTVKNAKKSLKISLISSGAVQIILAILGLALASYFMKHPDLMEYGTSIHQNADMLLPRFILVGLPVGISGLVVAGIMAAAMSSLSSGINSASTVIAEDVLDRHFPNNFRAIDPLRKIKTISIILGVTVTMSSMMVGFIQGNLLDIIIKLVNLFVAPLFVLFFLALFVPKATNKGAFIGGIISLAIAILIAFFDLFNLSILTIMPISLITGIITGWISSLIYGK